MKKWEIEARIKMSHSQYMHHLFGHKAEEVTMKFNQAILDAWKKGKNKEIAKVQTS